EVYYSADRAGSWKKISPSFQVDDDVKRDIAVLDGTIYVSTHRRVYYSSDMGSSWSVSDTFAVDKLLSPYLAAYASRLWIASRESLYYTSDRFATLHEASPPPGTRTGYSLTATKNGLLHSSYEGGAHLSFDTARTWTYIQEKVTPRAMSNVWVKDDLLIAGSESGILMCSTNNGNSWNRSFHSNPIDNRSNQFNALFALGDSLFVTTDKDHHIIRSGDNGMTWTTNQKEFPWSVTLDMVGNDMIWVAVTLFNGYMYRSTDRGASWTLIEGEYTASRFSEILLHDSTFFLAWHDTGLLRSNADATAFERLTDVGALPPGKCFSVASNGKTLFAGINRHIYRSRDSGVTWQEMNFLFDNEVYDIKCYGTNVVILDRPQEMYQKKTMVYYSPNECDTIISLSPDGFISRSSSEVAINNKYIFAQSIDWGILRYNYLPLVSVSEIKEQQQFTLYPNPAQTVVNIEAPDKANAIVHLFDMLGREVRRERLSEEGKLTLDVSDLTNGIYTVMLEYKGTTSKSTIVVMK
ncbi:MAG TPA: T9SS type A sorting domain-containing protein, partial [Candidatus Kapabacteria bacterium]